MKYELVGYDKDNDIYEIIETSENLEYLKTKGKEIVEIQKNTDSFHASDNKEPFDWFEIVQSDNYNVLYWVSYEEDEYGNRKN